MGESGAFKVLGKWVQVGAVRVPGVGSMKRYRVTEITVIAFLTMYEVLYYYTYGISNNLNT